ncbi:hypothetical protein [Acinetobacter populi]|uniref:Uncharacterized protein n=1 Tax=Acinetobacter populi TaxID=1582270 RepID=A0A1Z9Z1E1_9GAMM|nr:hypothetical protein [Acinetobacter populi]OUY08265.1 hypothetical protein CAP51_01190 [Acinetobacter populi]
MNRKQKNKFLLIFFSIILIVILVPAYPRNDFEIKLLMFIANNLKVTIGSNGSLPFYTAITSIYIFIVSLVFGGVIVYRILKKIGLNKKFQLAFYHHFFEMSISHQGWEKRWLKTPLRKKIYITCIMLFLGFFYICHFFLEDISFASGKRGEIIGLAYNNKIGVIIFESCSSIFLL